MGEYISYVAGPPACMLGIKQDADSFLICHMSEKGEVLLFQKGVTTSDYKGRLCFSLPEIPPWLAPYVENIGDDTANKTKTARRTQTAFHPVKTDALNSLFGDSLELISLFTDVVAGDPAALAYVKPMGIIFPDITKSTADYEDLYLPETEVLQGSAKPETHQKDGAKKQKR